MVTIGGSVGELASDRLAHHWPAEPRVDQRRPWPLPGGSLFDRAPARERGIASIRHFEQEYHLPDRERTSNPSTVKARRCSTDVTPHPSHKSAARTETGSQTVRQCMSDLPAYVPPSNWTTYSPCPLQHKAHPMIRLPSGRRIVAIAALVVVAAALCWISWRAGSPLLSGIRNYDVTSEILRLNPKPHGASPKTKVP